MLSCAWHGGTDEDWLHHEKIILGGYCPPLLELIALNRSSVAQHLSQ